jgi:DNA-directed RNA polymerase subunit RPC12/RpoP
MRKSNWYSIYICSICEHRLYNSELMDSKGTCPHCGHSCRGSVCDYEKVTLRRIKHHKWWQIFSKKITYEGRNKFSMSWLNKR